MASSNLVRGLEELLAEELGSATAGELLKELEVVEREGRLPVPSTVQLGTKLRSLRGRNLGGLQIQGRKSKRGVLWEVVDNAPPPPPPTPTPTPTPTPGREGSPEGGDSI